MTKNMSNKKITFIDLFAGIGGFRIALENLGMKCLFSSEINRQCQLTYRLNFNEFPRGDITKIKKEDIPDHDILTAGFPCQPFSICGTKKGFNDTRGTLFFNISRIIKNKNPKVILLENVKHLKYHNKGNTLKTILCSLEKLGYKTSWKILNAKDFGVAQNRERIIIIGNKDKLFDFSLVKTNNQEIRIKDILAKNKNGKEWLVIELKKGKSSDQVVGQILRYIAWIKENEAKQEDKVRGLIITQDQNEKLKYSIKATENIELMNYSVSFKLQKAK